MEDGGGLDKWWVSPNAFVDIFSGHVNKGRGGVSLLVCLLSSSLLPPHSTLHRSSSLLLPHPPPPHSSLPRSSSLHPPTPLLSAMRMHARGGEALPALVVEPTWPYTVRCLLEALSHL